MTILQTYTVTFVKYEGTWQKGQCWVEEVIEVLITRRTSLPFKDAVMLS